MAFEFRFPDVGEGIHEGRIVEWLVAEGEEVRVDQPFVKVETDKAVVDLPAPKAGKVLELRYRKGDTIRVGEVLAIFAVEGDEASQTVPPPRPPAPALPAAPPPSGAAPSLSPHEKVLATPHTRALARKLGVDLAAVVPTGKGGKITDEDVRRAAAGQASPPLPVPPKAGEAGADPFGPVERRPVTHLRKVIAEAMVLSKRTSAHVTHVDEADVTDLYALHTRLKPLAAREGVKLSLTAFFVKALAAMLKVHPLLNASFDEEREEIVLKQYVHMGLAVDTPEGLIVPVIRHADRKSLFEVAKEIEELAGKARERRLSLEELKGASFTLTNIGPIGGLLATPIIHQPEVAICAFFAAKERPVVREGQVAARRMMNLALTFDHRLIDGAEGARAAGDLVRLLETPEYLLLKG